jgi:hypothetical protein
MKLNLPVKKKQDTEVFTLRITSQMRQKINQVAKENTTTISEVARYALKNLLQDD